MGQSITDRSFKVRSGKILSNVNKHIKKHHASGANVSELIKETIDKQFGKQPDKNELIKKFYSEYGQELVHIISISISIPESKAKSNLKVISEPPKSKKPTISTSSFPAIKREEPKPEPKNTDLCDIIFSFDDTGSMAACRRIVRDYIDKMSADLLVKFKNLRVGIMIHGDYSDPVPDPCVELDFTKDWVSIKRFLEEKRNFQGGDAPECYEYVLHKAQSMTWRLNSNKILVLIGDDIPHPKTYPLNRMRLDWEEEALKLKNQGVQIISVQARNCSYANSFYQTAASITSGYHLRLTQFSQIADMLSAICYKGNNQLEQFRLSKAESLSSPTFKKNLDILDGKEVSISASGLTDFQMFDIPHDVSIKQFVVSLGLEFSPGRGYYEFTKRETVQNYKKVVVQDRETEIFYPDAAGRDMLKLPRSGTVKIHPRDYDNKYRFFIQSTSYNRILKKGTTFLYDVTGLS